MVNNYLKVALRAYSRQKLHTIINILGLSIGLASAILIFLYLHSELSYDSIFPEPDQTFRLGLKFTNSNGEINYDNTMPGGWGKRLVNDLEEVDGEYKSFWFGYPTSLRKKDSDNILLTEDIFWAQDDIYKFMHFPVIKGNREQALKNVNSLVICESAAKELFGDEDPLDKEVLLKHPFITENREIALVVSAVIKDFPENTHYKAKYFANYQALKPYLQLGENTTFDQFIQSMVNGPFELYIHTKKDPDVNKIQSYLNNLKDEVLSENPQVREQLGDTKIEILLRNVRDIHFDKDVQWVSEGSADFLYIYIFGGVAILVILVACINYMNLSTARSGKRSKEIGLRKSLGSLRQQLMFQFLFESFLMVLLGFVGAFVLVLIFLPTFNDITEKQITYSALLNGQLLTLIFILFLFVGLVSGIYPAFFLSGFNTIEVLKGRFSFSRGSQIFRKTLTGFQFAIAVFLLVITIVIVRQMDLMQNSRLNAGGDQILSIRHGGTADYNRYTAFKNAIKQDPDLQLVTFGNHLPRLDFFGPLQTPYRFSEINDEEYSWNSFNVDYDFPETFGLELIAGRTFEIGNVADSSSIILNETACKALGKAPNEVVGTAMTSPTVNSYFDYNYDKIRTGQVIGVVKDFPYKSAYQAIEPLVIDPTPHFIDRILYIKLPKGKYQEKIAYIEQKWKEVYPGIGLDYWFVSDEFNRMYKSEKRTAALAKNFSGLAILITCIGLFGLASFVAEQRTKEIGIRKAMGASNGQILALLLITFLKILFFASVVAVPLSYLASDRLLQNFIYRVPFDVWVGLTGVFTIALLTVLTVGYESLKASLVNPVKSLRYE